jgi:opacity protein-like surface antigen
MKSFSRFRVLAALGLMSLLACAIPTLTFADAGPLSIGGRAVEYTPQDGSNEYMGGVQARLRLPLFFGAEGSVDYRRDTNGDTTTHQWPVQLSGLIYLPKIIVVQPFLLAGVGWYNTTVHGPNAFDQTQNQFGPHAGAGVEINLSSCVFLDATYRYVWLNKLHSEDAQGASQDIRDSGHMITAGINFRL